MQRYILFATPTLVNGQATDRVVLRDLYNATNGRNWKRKTNWGSNASISEWEGVTTDSSGQVTKLDLSINQLTGPIPPAFVNIRNLKY